MGLGLAAIVKNVVSKKKAKKTGANQEAARDAADAASSIQSPFNIAARGGNTIEFLTKNQPGLFGTPGRAAAPGATNFGTLGGGGLFGATPGSGVAAQFSPVGGGRTAQDTTRFRTATTGAIAPGGVGGEFSPEINEARRQSIRRQIEEDTERGVSQAQGESARRGLTGGSFEGRRVGGAREAGQRSLAEAELGLSLEQAGRQREERMIQEGRLFQAGETQKQRLFSAETQEFGAKEREADRVFASGEAKEVRQFQADSQTFNAKVAAEAAANKMAFGASTQEFAAGETARAQNKSILANAAERATEREWESIKADYSAQLEQLRTKRDAFIAQGNSERAQEWNLRFQDMQAGQRRAEERRANKRQTQSDIFGAGGLIAGSAVAGG